MATTSLQRRVRLGGRLRLGRGLRARSRLSRLRIGPHALAKGMLEGLPYVAILLLLLLLLLVLFLILLFIFLFLLCASRLSTRQSKIDRLLARRPSTTIRRRPRRRTGRRSVQEGAVRLRRELGTAEAHVVVPVRGLVVVAVLPRQARSSQTPDVRAGRVRRACDDAPLNFPVRLCDLLSAPVRRI